MEIVKEKPYLLHRGRIVRHRERGTLAVEDLDLDDVRREVLERDLAGCDLEQDHAEAEHVRLLAARGRAFQDLGRAPVRRLVRQVQAHRGADLVGVLGEPEVGHFGRAAVVEQHVGRAQIAVHDLLRARQLVVQVAHRERDVEHDRVAPRRRQRLLVVLHAVQQAPAVHELEHVAEVRLVHHGAEHADHLRVRDLRHEVGLGAERLGELLGERRDLQLLERDDLVVPRGAVHAPKGALAELAPAGLLLELANGQRHSGGDKGVDLVEGEGRHLLRGAAVGRQQAGIGPSWSRLARAAGSPHRRFLSASGARRAA